MKAVKTTGRNGAVAPTTPKKATAATRRLTYAEAKKRIVTGERGGQFAILFSAGDMSIMDIQIRRLVSTLVSVWGVPFDEALARAVQVAALDEERKARTNSERLVAAFNRTEE